MKKTRRTLWILLAAVAVILLGAAAVSAAGTAGTEDDPLVTLSYLNEVFTLRVKELFQAELTERETALREELEGRIAPLEAAAGISLPEGSDYQVVTVTDGQTILCQRGAELLLRVGEASVVASDTPGLVDTSSTENLNNGEALVKNHLYMVTINGHGIRASGTVKIVVRGEYTIS